MLFKVCRKKKHEAKPGEILDQVISQSSSIANKCLLYKLANYKRGGDLIDAFQKGGQIAVESLIREQFGTFMYNNGKGQLINRAEYLRWKYMDNKEVVIPIEASLSQHDPLAKCSLHLAIAYSNNSLVADLIEAGADVNQRAIGSFFLPRDQQGSRPVKNTDYEGLAYLGEYPLAWSACCANESVYNLLLEHDADPDLQDSFGNMILHMVVVCDKLDMFGYALRHPKLPAKNGIMNAAGLTPLTLACKLGRAEVFREMLELSAKEFWRYSNITCSGYPLNALDTLLPDGRTNWNSALFIILNGTKEEHLDMLDGGIIQRLLEEKWKTFARNQFLKRLLILFVHLFFLSISVYMRPSTENLQNKEYEESRTDRTPSADGAANNDDSNGEEDDDSMNITNMIRYFSEVATLTGVLSYVVFQQGDEIKNQGLSAFLKQLAHAPAKAIFLISNIMILACIPFRLIGDTDTEEAILVFAVPGSWFLLMFFAGAVRLTGPFVTMIYSMITGDMFTFGIIYVIVLFGFSQAFYFLYKGHPQVEQTLFATYPTTWMALFQTTLGDYNYSDLNNTTYPNLAKTVFVIFMIFVPILLLNMLIAMMGNTYAHVIEQSEKEWMKQWAKIVVTLERAVSQSDAQKYLEQYSIPLGPADDSGYETRGVMVIKSKSKTRAKQRKGAVSNWKRVGKVTLNALKSRGLTGEELRRIMWGRASITSPTKVSKKKMTQNMGIGQQAVNAAGVATTGALSTAVDRMSFAHDIVMMTDDAIAIGLGLDVENADKVFKDPLRELILMSENTSAKVDESYATNLAKEASVLSHVKEIHLETKTAPTPIPKPATLVTPAMVPQDAKSLTTAFQDKTNMVDPVKEREFLMKISAMEESDTEGVMNVERPILGKVSLIRRAKSAVSRSIIERRINDKHPLFSVAWENQKSIAKNESLTRQDSRAIDINVDDDEHGSDDDIPTPEEVKRHMELFHLRRGQPPPSAKLEECRKSKHSKSRSAKTKSNRVAPTDEDLEPVTKKTSRTRSAKFMSRVEKDEDSSPDPLEPWSTKDLLNINKILES
ncbi:transient receptor potential cation channel subfamily V member 4 isoform X2 [Contarinia nasturtii]|uniref:transient receptor potential cation channel subfamily V member 4 isoform X2 n=1 Tax=Contarinia nasturtii TaxID=265458 RepID=UPI0012D48CF9|nr:transient receptor potential cation channel subfamily V member 4 isoform X2 [Contarinia nasturtii]